MDISESEIVQTVEQFIKDNNLDTKDQILVYQISNKLLDVIKDKYLDFELTLNTKENK